MTSELKPSDVLSKAADLIEPEGCWRQGGLRVGRGQGRCIVDALSEAMPRRMMWGAVRDPLKAIIGTAFPINWNDDPQRTQAEVVTALRKAAELARSEGQ